MFSLQTTPVQAFAARPAPHLDQITAMFCAMHVTYSPLIWHINISMIYRHVIDTCSTEAAIDIDKCQVYMYKYVVCACISAVQTLDLTRPVPNCYKGRIQ